jgi:Insect cuticle protein
MKIYNFEFVSADGTVRERPFEALNRNEAWQVVGGYTANRPEWDIVTVKYLGWEQGVK